MIDLDECLPDGAEAMNTRTKRRKRRRANAKLKKFSAVRAHRHKTGRTGSIHEKHVPGKAPKYCHTFPNPPWQSRIEWTA